MADQWYYSRNGEQKGPVALADLQRLAASGELQPTDLVWRPGMILWIPAAETRSLFRAAQPDADTVPLPPAPEPILVQSASAPHQPATPRPVGPPRSRPNGRRGMSTGAKVAIFGGIAGMVVLVVIVALAVSLGRRPVSAAGSYGVHLAPNAHDIRKVHLVGGSHVTVRVINFVDTDVDLFINDDVGIPIVSDDRPNIDCIVSFRVPRTGMYEIEVVNVGTRFTQITVEYH